MFNKKPQKIEIEHQIKIENAEALHIKKTGSYILCLQSYVNDEQAKDIIKKMEKQTGAKWMIIQGGAKVITNV